MPRFFFDVDTGERRVRDEIGLDVATRADVAVETKTLLMILGQSEITNGRSRVFAAKVRDARGTAVYHGTVTLTCDRLNR